MMTRKALIAQNLQNNLAADARERTATHNRLLCDQYGATGKHFHFGKYPASHNACEVIALHNARILLGKSSCLSQAILDFQNCRAMIGKGYFGSNPLLISRVLRHYGMTYEKCRRWERNGVYILSFWNRHAPWRGLHTVAAEKTEQGFTTYNLHGNGRTCDLPPESYVGRRFICGYYLPWQ